MGIIFKKKQKQVIDEIIKWWKSSEQVYEFGGYAGTGKSTVLIYAINQLGLTIDEVAPMSFIGQPSIVMRMKGLINAKTIHSWLFEPVHDIKRDYNGNIIMDPYYNRPKTELKFVPKKLENKKLIVLDEAGAIPMYLKPEIESRGIKVLATGDTGQLRPVGDEPAYLYDKDIIILDEIARQSNISGILYLAHRARQGLPIHTGFYGDVWVTDEDSITGEMLVNADVVLCGRNTTRDIINRTARHDILRINSNLPVRGEKLICRKNNWTIENDGINLANGLAGIVINSPGIHSFDGDTFNIDFQPYMLNTPFMDIEVDYKYLTADYERRKILKNDKYSRGEKFEYAYATTVHLSQGSEYNNGIFIEEVLHPKYHNNFLYTGITRFRQGMILVKRKKRYY